MPIVYQPLPVFSIPAPGIDTGSVYDFDDEPFGSDKIFRLKPAQLLASLFMQLSYSLDGHGFLGNLHVSVDADDQPPVSSGQLPA